MRYLSLDKFISQNYRAERVCSQNETVGRDSKMNDMRVHSLPTGLLFSRKMGRLKLGLLALVASAGASAAHAYTQCQSTVASIWAGDGGMIWIAMDNGGAAQISSSDPNREAVIALATTALTTRRSIIIRYQADNVDCATFGRSDFVGMYLLK